MIGTTLGKYRITQRIAAGGMGEVYIGEHELIGRKAAVKVLLPHVSQRPNIVDRFFQEAKATAAIGHPGIVEIFDFGYHDADGRAYLVMEFLDGETLTARIKREHRLSLEQSVVIMRRVASALGAAHDKGIVHRDLKPDNIFLVPAADASDGERVKLLDFGIAKLQDTEASALKTGTGVVMGTPAYMAPEQCRGAGRVDHRADLYSVGCIFFEMVCGRRPFMAAGAGELIGMQQFMEPPRPSSLWPQVSPAAEALILDLLKKQSEDRVQSTGELRERLEALLPDHRFTGRVATRAGTMQSVEPSVPAPPVLPVPATGEPLRSSDRDVATPPPALQGMQGRGHAGNVVPGAFVPNPQPMGRGRAALGRGVGNDARAPHGQELTTLHSAASERPPASAVAPRTSHRWMLIGAVALVLMASVAGGFLMSGGGSDEPNAAGTSEEEILDDEDLADDLEGTDTVLVGGDTAVPADTDAPSTGAATQEATAGEPGVDEDQASDTGADTELAVADDIQMDSPEADPRASDEGDDAADSGESDEGDDTKAAAPRREERPEFTLTIDSKPTGASVQRGRRTLCTTPCTWKFKQDEYVRLVLQKAGYQNQSIRLRISRDQNKFVTLQKKTNIITDVY